MGNLIPYCSVHKSENLGRSGQKPLQTSMLTETRYNYTTAKLQFYKMARVIKKICTIEKLVKKSLNQRS